MCTTTATSAVESEKPRGAARRHHPDLLSPILLLVRDTKL